ncbi:MAG: hypothetical protein ACOYVI_09335, partial [Bacillota bacterium]
METLACVNGEILPAAGRHISPLDRGFRYGLGLFETLAAKNGRILFAREHLARLRAGAGHRASTWTVMTAACKDTWKPPSRPTVSRTARCG